MCYLSTVRDAVSMRLVFLLMLSLTPAACAGTAELVATGDPSLVVDVSAEGVVIENKTGTSLVKGEVHLVPRNFPRPYFTLLPRMANGEKRTFRLESFRMADGTPYRPSLARVRSVRVTATDIVGKKLEREIPFE